MQIKPKYDAKYILEREFTKEEFDAGVQRWTTIYKEYNPELCKQIVQLATSE
jgi:predicted choloylglycine hydrolase